MNRQSREKAATEAGRTMNRVAVRSLITAATIGLLFDCSSAQQLSAHAQLPTGEQKVLIVYLSRTNNTKAVRKARCWKASSHGAEWSGMGNISLLQEHGRRKPEQMFSAG
jgi:hypothetical protein